MGYFGSGTARTAATWIALNSVTHGVVATPHHRNDVELVWALVSHRQTETDQDLTRSDLRASNVHLGYHWPGEASRSSCGWG
ncbi:MAG: hypothetical protein R3F60_33640 [bacterium]